MGPGRSWKHTSSIFKWYSIPFPNRQAPSSQEFDPLPPGHAFALELPPPCPRIRSAARQPPDKGSQSSRCQTMMPWEFGSLGQRQRHSPSNSHDEFCFLTATTCVSASWECARQFQASSETRPTLVNHRHLLNLLNHRHLHTALHWHFNHLSGINC